VDDSNCQKRLLDLQLQGAFQYEELCPECVCKEKKGKEREVFAFPPSWTLYAHTAVRDATVPGLLSVAKGKIEKSECLECGRVAEKKRIIPWPPGIRFPDVLAFEIIRSKK